MDPLLILGDILHILALFFLLLKINSTNNVRGVSYKTQEIYLIVFLTRYSDMLIIRYRFHGYFVITRLLLIGITALIIYYTRCKLPHSKAYDYEEDSFPRYYTYLVAAVIAIVMPQHETLYAYLWTFSIWLQAMAIIPQLYLTSKWEQTQNFTTNIVLMLGLYRVCYILHWIFYWQKVKAHSMIAGVIQTILCVKFIYSYFMSKRTQQFMSLPA